MSGLDQEVKITVKGILGVSSPFFQGGSIRLTIPKRAVKKYGMELKAGKEFNSLVFLETDKGMLLLPLEKVVRPDTIRGALEFVNLSELSDKDLASLLEEDEDIQDSTKRD